MDEWSVAVQSHDRLGESALWHPVEQALYWIDLHGPAIHRLDPVTKVVVHWHVPDANTIGSIAFASRGRLIAAAEHEIRLFDTVTGKTEFFADPNERRPGLGYNDSKVDRHGRYWVGNYDSAEAAPRAILYRVGRDGSAAIGDSGFVVCNGPAFSPDNRILYFSDTLGRRLLAYDLDAITGALSGRRVLAEISLDEGIPDGIAVDSAGDVWCAQYGGGCVSRFRADGELAEKIALPVPHVTSCCLGGADLRTLYVTTGWGPSTTKAGERGDIGGAVFARRVTAPGLPEPIFEPTSGAIS